MVTSRSWKPSIHRLELKRLLNKPSNSLSTSECAEFLSHLAAMDLEFLLGMVVHHSLLGEHEEIIATLHDRVDAMNLRELGISLTLYPGLLGFDEVLRAFHATVDCQVKKGRDVHGLANEFAMNLGRDTYEVLVERAFRVGAPDSDAHRAFRWILYRTSGRHEQAVSSNDGPTPPGVEVADRESRAHADAEEGRRKADWQASLATLKARLYRELPSPEEVARLDATSRAAWNEKIRSELVSSKRVFDGSALYYLRYPSRDALFDKETIAQLQGHIVRDRLDAIIATEDLRSFISREQVAEQVIQRPDELMWLERAPEWLDAALIRRARRARCEPELWALVARFVEPGKEKERKGLLVALVERAKAKDAAPTFDLYAMAAELLSGSKSMWKSEDLGQDLVLAALRRRDFCHLQRLIFGRPPKPFERLEDIEAALKDQVIAMHYAFATALLRRCRELAVAGDSQGVERMLGALGVLDPPRYFTNDLHTFRVDVPLSDDARHLADHIYGIAKAQGGSDAQVHALFQCIDELRASNAVASEDHQPTAMTL